MIQSKNNERIIFKPAINLKRNMEYISRIVKGIIIAYKSITLKQ